MISHFPAMSCEMLMQEGMTYAEMFVATIKSFGVLCIGLYRLRDATLSPDENPSAKRYVITNPADDSTLLYTDKVGSRVEKRRLLKAHFN